MSTNGETRVKKKATSNFLPEVNMTFCAELIYATAF